MNKSKLRLEEMNIKKDLEKISPFLDYLPDKLTTGYIKDYLNEKRSWLYTVNYNNYITGFSLTYSKNEFETEYWLNAVHPDYRNKGIASMLLDNSLTISKDSGYLFMYLSTFNKALGILRLCKSRGFTYINKEKIKSPFQNNKFLVNFVMDLSNWISNPIERKKSNINKKFKLKTKEADKFVNTPLSLLNSITFDPFLYLDSLSIDDNYENPI